MAMAAQPPQPVGDAGGRIASQPRVYVRDGWQPFLSKLAHVGGTVERGLRLARLVAEGGVGHAATAPECRLERWRLAGDGHDQSAERGEIGQAVPVQQHFRVAGRQAIAPLGRLALTSNTSGMPATACCSSHSRA